MGNNLSSKQGWDEDQLHCESCSGFASKKPYMKNGDLIEECLIQVAVKNTFF